MVALALKRAGFWTSGRGDRVRTWLTGLARRAGHREPPAARPGSDWLPVLSAEALLSSPPRRARLSEIQHLVSLSPAHYAALYEPALHAFAAYVQQLPGSEAHHHAGPGGLLDHGLDVTATALKLRRAHILPPDAPTETIKAQAELWSYAVATAALLHDVAKPAVDHEVVLLDRQGGALGAWDPWTGPMPSTAHGYRMRFRRGRRYRLHTRAALLQARLVVPPAGLKWLTSEPEVLAAWLAAVLGDSDEAGVVGACVERADGLSAASDLSGGTPSRMPSARAKPLHERLATGLRYLVDEERLALNRPGAAGWLCDDDLWLVVKTALDQLRAHLEAEGQSGIPANARLMDELQQRGVLTPCGERAVWRASVTLGEWQRSFTLLRIPAARLWPDAEARPPACAGTITPIGAETAAPAEDAAAPASTEASDERAHEPDDGADSDAARTRTDESPPLADNDAAAASPPRSTDDATSAEPEGATDSAPDLGKRFLAWVAEGLKTERLAINKATARIHRVEGGLLLVSPALFKDFASSHDEAWSTVQKRFQKLKLHRKTEEGLNIWTYQVTGDRRKHNRLKGLVIVEPERALGLALPEINPHVRLLAEASESSGRETATDNASACDDASIHEATEGGYQP